MYVHERTGLVYLANPRTASRSTAFALTAIGFEMVGSHHSGPEGNDSGSLVFTTVRPGEETLRSWAHYLGCEPWEVSEVMDRTNQRGIIEGWESWTLFPHAWHADVLLHFTKLHAAHFKAQLNHLLEEHDLPAVELPWIGRNGAHEEVPA